MSSFAFSPNVKEHAPSPTESAEPTQEVQTTQHFADTQSSDGCCGSSCSASDFDDSGEQIEVREITSLEAFGVDIGRMVVTAKAEYYFKDGVEYRKSLFGGGRRVWMMPDGQKTTQNPHRNGHQDASV